MRRTRVVVVGVRGVLNGIIRGVIEQQTDLELVAELSRFRSLPRVVRSVRPDYVVAKLGAEHQLPEPCVRAMRSVPDLRVLGVSRDGEQVDLYEMKPRMRPLGELSVDLLLRLLRGHERSKHSARPRGVDWRNK